MSMPNLIQFSNASGLLGCLRRPGNAETVWTPNVHVAGVVCAAPPHLPGDDIHIYTDGSYKPACLDDPAAEDVAGWGFTVHCGDHWMDFYGPVWINTNQSTLDPLVVKLSNNVSELVALYHALR